MEEGFVQAPSYCPSGRQEGNPFVANSPVAPPYSLPIDTLIAQEETVDTKRLTSLVAADPLISRNEL
jgi:hypothetical protein